VAWSVNRQNEQEGVQFIEKQMEPSRFGYYSDCSFSPKRASISTAPCSTRRAGAKCFGKGRDFGALTAQFGDKGQSTVRGVEGDVVADGFNVLFGERRNKVKSLVTVAVLISKILDRWRGETIYTGAQGEGNSGNRGSSRLQSRRAN
jgi:hypothetical protein